MGGDADKPGPLDEDEPSVKVAKQPPSECQLAVPSTGESPDKSNYVKGESLVGVRFVCFSCEMEYVLEEEDLTKYRIKDHCLCCSGKCRSVLANTKDESVRKWFQGLRYSDPEEYRKIIKDAQKKTSSQLGAGSYLTPAKFNLAKYQEVHEESKGHKQGSEWELLTFPWYKAGSDF